MTHYLLVGEVKLPSITTNLYPAAHHVKPKFAFRKHLDLLLQVQIAVDLRLFQILFFVISCRNIFQV
jgi:hypothetical protein